MIYSRYLERAAQYYPGQAAVAAAGKRATFRELQDRVSGIADGLRNTVLRHYKPVTLPLCGGKLIRV